MSPDECDCLGVFEPILELSKSTILPFPTFTVLCSPTENVFATQIRTGPSYPVPAADDYEHSPYDSSDNEDQPIHPLTLPGAKSKKKAYNVYWGHSTGTSSAEIQVKYFSGACYEGFPSVEDAIAAWDIAVVSNAIGPPPAGAHRRPRNNAQPSTPSQSMNSNPSHSPISMPSHGGSSTLCGSSNPSLRSSSTSETITSATPPATPSSRGSVACLTSITTALEGLSVDAYFIVIRGQTPSVYTSSSAALAATGNGARGLCCMVATRELANAMFVDHMMSGDVETIL
ncbi:hypothetical protein K443DRAFT_13643 [Laccaria amethystina LaAM-08-1]|uniref:Uncharacterized protein n=1 Tax=Laccaria amethystina LaAM-08-1 TaxID=1095629 RepID=A0A0C9WUX7_9AGAR|nr:hypothetical protein K443DRAFT_13643 [Laccaria amethystina LaAM-08-1]